jgi:hypothetical protein
MSPVAVDAGNPGKLGPVQGPIGHDDEAGAQAVAAISGNNPPELVFTPGYLFDLRLKQGIAIQIEFPPDPAGMFQNFRCVGVFFLWNVPRLLKQRQIDIRLDIALCARITVPVPGAAEVAAPR